MMKRKNNRLEMGQNLIEFTLIIGLVAVCGIFALTILGNNTNTVYQGATASIADYSPFKYQSSSPANPFSLSGVNTSPVTSAENIGGQTVNLHQDGGMSFQVGAQTVNLSKEVIEKNNQMFQTTSATGMNDLVQEIASIINENKALYPDQEVPVSVSFGNGERIPTLDDWSSYKGETSVNTALVNVGNNFVILQNDQICVSPETDNTCGMKGVYRIEGSIKENSKFEGTVSGRVTQEGYITDAIAGDYSADVLSREPLVLNNSLSHIDTGVYEADFAWDIKFADELDSE